MKPIIIMSTYPNKKVVKKIASIIIKEKLAACVNISNISSIYIWKGKIEDTPEYLALFKTTLKNKKKLITKIRSTHPYDVPEIAEINVNSINKPYLMWLTESTL